MSIRDSSRSLRARQKAAALSLTALSAFLAAVANLLMRAGLLQAPSFNLSIHSAAGLARQPLFLLGILVYAIAAVLWLNTLRKQELISTYTIFVALTFLIVNIGAAVWFHESMSFLKLTGLCVIAGGIALVSTDKRMTRTVLSE